MNKKPRKKTMTRRPSPNPGIWARADMINMLREEHGLTVYGATHLLNSMLHVFTKYLIPGETLRFTRFGKLESRVFKQQDLVYFGRRKELPSRRVLRFSPAPRIREYLNHKRTAPPAEGESAD